MNLRIGMMVFASVVSLAAAAPEIRSARAADAAKAAAEIDPNTFSRFPLLKREQMKGDALKYYDEQAKPSPDGTPFYQRGPQHLYLYSPALAGTSTRVLTALRDQGVLNDRIMETAILVTSREIDHQFIWSAHEPAARRVGVEAAVIDTIKFNKEISGLSEKDTVIIRYGRELLRTKKISPELFAKAVDVFGRQGVVELTAVMANYVGTSVMLNAANQQQPPTRPALLPPR